MIYNYLHIQNVTRFHGRKAPLLAGKFAGSDDSVFLLVPYSVSGIDIMLMDSGSGAVTSLTLTPGLHFVPIQLSGAPLIIQGLSDEGLAYDGALGGE